MHMPTKQYQNFVLPLLILFAGAVAQTAVEYHFSADVRGWWPLILGFRLMWYAFYSALFGFIAGGRVLPTAYIMGLNGLLSAVELLHSYLYHTLLPTDWTAVNANMVQLTLAQRVVQSDWLFLMPVPFLVAHFVAVRAGWLAPRQ